MAGDNTAYYAAESALREKLLRMPDDAHRALPGGSVTGELAILNAATGDTKLTFDPSKPEEVKRSARIVKDMIRRGFVLLIEVGRDEKGPTYRRAHDFDEATAEYIVAGLAGDAEETPDNEQESASAPRIQSQRPAQSRRASKTRVPASAAKAVAVARTAGG
jgi:hypothetical protein